jgi:hypothetical protein
MTVTSQKSAQVSAAAPASLVAKWAPLAVILCGTFVFILDSKNNELKV